jgi:phage-related holin/ribosomal protein L37E
MKKERAMKRCKACNYFAYEDEIKGVCPACGLPDRVFEPYEKKATGLRHLILDIHFHSISLHIPQAVGPIIILLYLASIVLVSFRTDLYFLLKILVIVYPLAVVPALFSGLIDGNLRFKKVFTPILKKKLILAVIVLVITTSISVAAILADNFSANVHFIVLPAFISLAIQGTLARIGIRLVECMVPWK